MSAIFISAVFSSDVSEIAIVPDSECRMPTLIGPLEDCACANGTRPASASAPDMEPNFNRLRRFMCIPLPLMMNVYGRRSQPQGRALHDLPLLHCKEYAMLMKRAGWQRRALWRGPEQAGLCVLAYECGACRWDAPRSGAGRAATRRENRQAGFDGAHAQRRCAWGCGACGGARVWRWLWRTQRAAEIALAFHGRRERGSVLFDSARVSPPAWRRQRTRSIGCERGYRRVVRRPRRLFRGDRNRKIAAIFAAAAGVSNV